MALIKFIITALAAALMITTTVAGPAPALAAVGPTDTTAYHLEKRVCNQYGCGMKCKGTVNTPCKMMDLKVYADCQICAYMKYAADGSGSLSWDMECLYIQWGKLPPHDRC